MPKLAWTLKTTFITLKASSSPGLKAAKYLSVPCQAKFWMTSQISQSSIIYFHLLKKQFILIQVYLIEELKYCICFCQYTYLYKYIYIMVPEKKENIPMGKYIGISTEIQLLLYILQKCLLRFRNKSSQNKLICNLPHHAYYTAMACVHIFLCACFVMLIIESFFCCKVGQLTLNTQ